MQMWHQWAQGPWDGEPGILGSNSLTIPVPSRQTQTSWHLPAGFHPDAEAEANRDSKVDE